MTDFLVDHLPSEVYSVTKLKNESTQEPLYTSIQAPVDLSSLSIVSDPFAVSTDELDETPLPSGYSAHLVTTTSEESHEELVRFLSGLLSFEIQAIPRGTISSAMIQCQAPSSLERSVRGMENMLKGVCLANQSKDSPYGQVAGITLHDCI